MSDDTEKLTEDEYDLVQWAREPDGPLPALIEDNRAKLLARLTDRPRTSTAKEIE